MGWEHVLEEVAEEFVENPLNFVTEDDVQVRLAHRLQEYLNSSDGETSFAEWRDPEFDHRHSMRYKQNYRKQMEEKLKDAGSIRRVHTEPTTRTTDEEGHNFVDIVVFRNRIDGVIEWTSSGSKRYPRDAIEVAIELKFVKNLRKPETPESGETARDTYLLKDIQSLRNRTAEGTARYLFVVSLLDHLYVDDNHDPAEWKNEQYAEWGQQAQRWLVDNAGDVQILYVTPMQKTWLTD